jgi:hypothetical protein
VTAGSSIYFVQLLHDFENHGRPTVLPLLSVVRVLSLGCKSEKEPEARVRNFEARTSLPNLPFYYLLGCTPPPSNFRTHVTINKQHTMNLQR